MTSLTRYYVLKHNTKIPTYPKISRSSTTGAPPYRPIKPNPTPRHLPWVVDRWMSIFPGGSVYRWIRNTVGYVAWKICGRRYDMASGCNEVGKVCSTFSVAIWEYGWPHLWGKMYLSDYIEYLRVPHHFCSCPIVCMNKGMKKYLGKLCKGHRFRWKMYECIDPQRFDDVALVPTPPPKWFVEVGLAGSSHWYKVVLYGNFISFWHWQACPTMWRSSVSRLYMGPNQQDLPEFRREWRRAIWCPLCFWCNRNVHVYVYFLLMVEWPRWTFDLAWMVGHKGPSLKIMQCISSKEKNNGGKVRLI